MGIIIYKTIYNVIDIEVRMRDVKNLFSILISHGDLDLLFLSSSGRILSFGGSTTMYLIVFGMHHVDWLGKGQTVTSYVVSIASLV